MSLSECELQTKSLMLKYGLTNYKFRYKPSKYVLGTTRYDKQEIRLNPWFVRHYDWERIKIVVLHEIAHALTGPDMFAIGHGKEWREKCLELGGDGLEHASDIREPTKKETIQGIAIVWAVIFVVTSVLDWFKLEFFLVGFVGLVFAMGTNLYLERIGIVGR